APPSRVARVTKSRIADFVAPSFHEESTGVIDPPSASWWPSPAGSAGPQAPAPWTWRAVAAGPCDPNPAHRRHDGNPMARPRPVPARLDDPAPLRHSGTGMVWPDSASRGSGRRSHRTEVETPARPRPP